MELTTAVKELVQRSLASTTRAQYECGYQSYTVFLRMSGVVWNQNTEMPPLTEESLMHFATHCFKSLKLKYSTIKLYICGIRYRYLEAGVPNVFDNRGSANLPRLESVYRGIKRSETKVKKIRLPITVDILRKICIKLRNGCFSKYTDSLMEATCVMAYFGFLRCGEFTVHSEFDREINLCLGDILFKEDAVVLTLKTSKTDPFRLGVDIELFATAKDICPVSSLKRYLTIRKGPSKEDDPLFVLENGLPLNRNEFVKNLRSVLNLIGYKAELFAGHSFRIGAATSIGTRVDDHMIQTLGRWNSQCYIRYIRTPREILRQAQLALIH